MNLTFQEAAWCYVFAVPDYRTGKNYKPGAADTYGRVNPADGHYYTYLTEGLHQDRHGRFTGGHKVSRDLNLSFVYSERVFFAAEDDEGKAVDTAEGLYEQLARIKFYPPEGFWEPTWLFRGWSKGATAWRLALRAHTDIGPRWYNVVEALAKLPPEIQQTPSRGRKFVDLYLEDNTCPAS
jgi:hypothetical protein